MNQNELGYLDMQFWASLELLGSILRSLCTLVLRLDGEMLEYEHSVSKK